MITGGIRYDYIESRKRNPDIKAKKLRREGFAPGVLFGKGMDESVPLQFAEADVLQFIRKNGEGTQVTLDLGSEKDKRRRQKH